MRNSRHWLVASCAVAAMSVALPAFAQKPADKAAAAAADEEKEGTVIERVVVTAERRATNVQDTPLAITAFTDKTRENLGIATIQDLQQFSPGLSYNAQNDRPTIRGVGRQNNSHGLNSPVANYIDGIYTSTVQDTSRRPIFIDRSEIIRGPQGALSGKGSEGGSINTFLKRPKKYFEAQAGAYFNNFQRDGFEGTVTGPLTDNMQFRLNLARYYQGDGFFTNLEDGHTEGDRFGNRTLFDAMLHADIGAKTDFFFRASTSSYYETLHDAGTYAPVFSAVTATSCNPTPFTGGLTPSNNYGYFGLGTGCGQIKAATTTVDPQATIYGAGLKQNPVYLGGDLRSYINNYHSDLHLEGYYQVMGDLTHHMNNFDVRYIAGFTRYAYEQSSDADGSAVMSYNLPTTPGNFRRIDANGVNIYREEPAWYTNELTFTSTWDKKWQWIVGFFQFNQLTKQPTSTQIYKGFPEVNTPYMQPFTANGQLIPAIPNARPFNTQYGKQTTDQDSWATFFQLDYKFNDKWNITGGLRYNEDRQRALEQARQISVGTNGLGASGCFSPTAVGSTFNALNPSVCPLPTTPVSLDVSNTTLPGFALATPATVVDPGYRTIDITGMRSTGFGTGSCQYLVAGVCASAAQTLALLAPGVAGLPRVNPLTGERERDLFGKWHALAGSVGINYQPSTDTLFYLRFARGYRPGGFGSTNAGFLPLNPYTDKEKLNSVEAGTKFTLWSKLQMDVSLYHYDYFDQQAELTRFERCLDANDFTTCTAVGVTVNIPKSINQGVEIEGQWFVTSNLQLTLSYSYLDAHIDKGKIGLGFEDTNDPSALFPSANRLNRITCATASATCVPQVTGGTVSAATPGFALDAITLQPRWTQDLSGKTQRSSPKHKIAVNANYTFHLPQGNLTGSVSYIWRDKAFSDLFNDDVNIIPSYTQTNARLIFREKDDKWQAILFAQNVFDSLTFEAGGVTRRAAISETGTAPPHTVISNGQIYYRTYGLVLPRVYGIEILKKFR